MAERIVVSDNCKFYIYQVFIYALDDPSLGTAINRQ